MAPLLGHGLVDITYLSIYEFRDALEDNHNSWKSIYPGRLDCYLGAMAEWIAHGVDVIYRYLEEEGGESLGVWRGYLREFGFSREVARWITEVGGY